MAERVGALNLPAIRYVLTLEKFEEQPPPDHPKRAAFDVLIAALNAVAPRLAELPMIERGRESSATALPEED